MVFHFLKSVVSGRNPPIDAYYVKPIRMIFPQYHPTHQEVPDQDRHPSLY